MKQLTPAAIYQRARHDKLATKSAGKCQCLICGKWYVQVGTHIVQRHGMTCREYREEFGLEVKRGITSAEFRKRKGDKAKENGTYKNLLKYGTKHRFKKGQKGIGVYKRSPITLHRLKTLYKLRTN